MKNEKSIRVVGIGPGTSRHLTPAAAEAIASSDVVVGYVSYVEMVSDLIIGKEIVSTGMTGEVERCRAAARFAAEGRRVALISSGDAGIYGMAGLLFELLENDDSAIEIEVVSGVTAASSAAAVLGAPLMNDFATLSLSDLMTPAEIIRDRVSAVSAADLVCALYNPASRRRRTLLPFALERFAENRGPDLVCGMVKNASRVSQEVWMGRISDFPVERADMSTVVIIGNSHTEIIDGRMVTKRGYKL
ncbi:MAG: precorrin-3B C(17)-methyltransferase [Kiritimatiellaeota bacterium]|nr:precorrin-3B C(17)-methyltransferase [Kiritimatiellota bacterium]